MPKSMFVSVPRHRYESITVRHRAAARFGWLAIIAGMVIATCGCREVMRRRLGHTLVGCRITGSTAVVVGCWWKGIGAKRDVRREKSGAEMLRFCLRNEWLCQGSSVDDEAGVLGQVVIELTRGGICLMGVPVDADGVGLAGLLIDVFNEGAADPFAACSF